MLRLSLDILPIFFTMFLGYAAGWFHEFSEADAGKFNRLVFDFALPALLFTSVTQTSRASMVPYFALALITAVILNLMLAAAYFTARFVFHRDRREATVAALLCSFPASGLLGMAVLSPLYGPQAGVTVAVVATVSNVTQVPAAMILLSPAGSSSRQAMLGAVRQPIVWVPLVAVIGVLAGWKIPVELASMLDLLGSTSSGVAIFAAGVTISAHAFRVNPEVVWNTVVKMLIVPGALLGVLSWWGASKEDATEFIYLAAMSPAFTCMIIASRFEVYVQNASASLVLGTLSFAGTAPLWAFFAGGF